MTANGKIMHCSRSQNKDIFLAALCSLGAVGIILTVTWQCEQAFRLLQLSEPKPLEEVCMVFNKNWSRRENCIYLVEGEGTTQAKGITLGLGVWGCALPARFLKFGPLNIKCICASWDKYKH